MRTPDHILNRLKVLKAIRRAGPLARRGLPEITGLSGGTITQATSDLLKRGLIVEARDTIRRAGRPRTHLEINARGAIVIGANIPGGNVVTASCVDLSGTRRFSLDVPYPPPRSIEEQANGVASALEEVIVASPFSKDEICRVGIAIPGEVDSRRGIVHLVTTLPPGPVDFAGIVSDRIGLPVTIENNAVCMARAEHWFGRAQHLQSFTLVDIGHAIGSAEYEGGVPKYGANGFSAEIGHMKVASGADARPCFCGARGCLMSVASMYGIARQLDLMGDVPFWSLDTLFERFSAFLDRADAGDAEALGILDNAGYHIGLAISNHLNIADPGDVLILASEPRLFQYASASLKAAIRENTLQGVFANTRILFETSNEDWRWKGTAALALEQTFLASG